MKCKGSGVVFAASKRCEMKSWPQGKDEFEDTAGRILPRGIQGIAERPFKRVPE